MRLHKRFSVRTLLASAAVLAATAATPALAEDYTIATVVKLSGVGWFDRMEEGVKEFGATHPNVKAFQQGPGQADAAQQAQIIEDLIAQKVSAITVVPLSPKTLEPVLKKAMDNGIVVIAHEGAIQENVNYDLEAFDNAAYGRHLMDELASRMGEEGEYAVFVGKLTNVTHNVWVDSAVEYQKTKYPKMTMVGTKNVTDEDVQTAYRVTQELLAAYPNLKGFQGSASTDVVGIGQAIEEAGLEGKTAVVGTSLVSMAGNLLETGAVDMIGFWDPKLAGIAMNQIALTVLEGGSYKTGDNLGLAGYESVTVDGKVISGQAWVDVTAENMGDYNF